MLRDFSGILLYLFSCYRSSVITCDCKISLCGFTSFKLVKIYLILQVIVSLGISSTVTLNSAILGCRVLFCLLIVINILYLFRGGREGEREGNISVWLPLMCPPLGTWPTTPACAPTGNRTGDPLVRRPALNPLSHTSQGLLIVFLSSLISNSSSV